MVQAGTPSGVYPVRVTTPLGLAGPAQLPLLTVEYEILSISPAAGSFGGGQSVTVTGINLPTDPGGLWLDLELHTTTHTCHENTSAVSEAHNENHHVEIPCSKLGHHINETVPCKVSATSGLV